MNASTLEYIDYNPSEKATACVIWLHGLGADGNDFVDIVPRLALPASLPIRFIFPHAPIRPVTLNGGMPMRAWFDIVGLGKDYQEDTRGLREAEETLDELIQQESQNGIPPDRIVIAGFSQGGALALYAGLRYPEKLAGLIGLSTYLPSLEKFSPTQYAANKETPIMLAHGRSDPIVKIEWDLMTKEALERFHYSITWHTYDMEHSVCTEEIRDISSWLCRTLT